MKRFLTMLLCAAVLVSTFAAAVYAEPSAAAQNVIEKIAALDENATPEQLTEAIAAYDALSEEDKAEVWNYNKIEAIEQTYVDQLINDIDALGDISLVNYFHHESAINKLLVKYNTLSDSAKAKVTNIDALNAAKAKIDATVEWTANKSVNILNSTLEAFADYTLDDMYEYLGKKSEGIYYYFEEVGLLGRGDPTMGYFDLEEDNDFVANYKYAKLDLDVKITDLDFEAGWPSLKFLAGNIDPQYWAGFEFVNNSWFIAGISRWSQGFFSPFYSTADGEFALGVWHHLTVLFDNESVSLTLDGEVVFEAQHDGSYQFLIIYPWLCNLEMTNVRFTNRYGKETLSPFKTHVNEPSGWTLSPNDSEATMLDNVEESVDAARSAYNALSDSEKEQIVDAAQIERVQALIDAARAGKRQITVTNGEADVEFALPGDTVTITAYAPGEGMRFDRWTGESDSGAIVFADKNAAQTTFVMVDENVSVSAHCNLIAGSGDADGDGYINERDVILTMRAALPGFVAPAEYVREAADMDGNDEINARDVIEVMKTVLEQAIS